MKKVKITSDKIEEIFTLMTFFKPNELIKFEYSYIKSNAITHTLYVTLAAIKESSFINRVRNFNKLQENLLIVEVLENSDATYYKENAISKTIPHVIGIPLAFEQNKSPEFVMNQNGESIVLKEVDRKDHFTDAMYLFPEAIIARDQ